MKPVALTALALAGATAALAPSAHASPASTAPSAAQPYVAQQGPAAAFAAETRARMDEIDRAAREAQRTHDGDATVLDALASRRQTLEQILTQAQADGVISDAERVMVNGQLAQMRADAAPLLGRGPGATDDVAGPSSW